MRLGNLSCRLQFRRAPSPPRYVCYRRQSCPAADVPGSTACDPGCVKTLEAIGRLQQKNRACSAGESFMRERRPVFINLARERPAKRFSHAQDPTRTCARSTLDGASREFQAATQGDEESVEPSFTEGFAHSVRLRDSCAPKDEEKCPNRGNS